MAACLLAACLAFEQRTNAAAAAALKIVTARSARLLGSRSTFKKRFSIFIWRIGAQIKRARFFLQVERKPSAVCLLFGANWAPLSFEIV